MFVQHPFVDDLFSYCGFVTILFTFSQDAQGWIGGERRRSLVLKQIVIWKEAFMVPTKEA